MNGLELRLQRSVRGARIPIIFITGHGNVPMAVKAMHQGAFDLLEKPFQDESPIDTVRRGPQRDAKMRAALAQREAIRQRFCYSTAEVIVGMAVRVHHPRAVPEAPSAAPVPHEQAGRQGPHCDPHHGGTFRMR